MCMNDVCVGRYVSVVVIVSVVIDFSSSCCFFVVSLFVWFSLCV